VKCPNCGAVLDPPRTRAQQGLLHSLIQRYARELGYDMEHAKMELKLLHGGYVLFADIGRGVATMPKERGQIVDLSHYWMTYPPESWAFVYSEASYSSEYETGFIQFVQSRCFEADVDIEDLL
jgi:hypothetical protein